MLLTICISSAPQNSDRRRALRRSWLQYIKSESSIPDSRAVEYVFVLGRESAQQLQVEAENEADLLFLDVSEGYENLWRKTLAFLKWANAREPLRASDDDGRYFMHVDDDSFVRLDLLVPDLRKWPKERFYWGYIWDPDAGRVTAPIRNPANKSHMPEEQYPLDYYPPFASGCGFILSWDLVLALLAADPPDYRLLDPPFGIHLTGTDRCCLKQPVVPVHDDRVRPYRPMPIFRPDTLVQHYLQPAEMVPFYKQATGEVEYTDSDADADRRIEGLYDRLVGMGLLRR